MKILIYIVAAVLGAFGGALLMHSRLAPEMAAQTRQVQSLELENNKLKSQVNKLMAEWHRMNEQQAEPQSKAEEPQASPEADGLPEITFEDIAEAFAPSPANARRTARRRDPAEAFPVGEEDSQDGQPDEGQEDPEDRQARFREFERRMRERVDAQLQQEYENAADADTQERIQTIQAYMDQITQLRTAMRESTSEEEQHDLRRQMWDAYNGMRATVEAQQDSMLRSFAANSGVSDPERQDAFITGFRELQGSPFFQADRMLGDGRGPWRREPGVGGGDLPGGGRSRGF